MHALALHVRAGLAPELQGLRVVAKLDTDLLQYPVGIGLDKRQALLVQHLVGPDLAMDEGLLGTGSAARTRRPPRRRAATIAARAP
jgi:hypothetical protein